MGIIQQKNIRKRYHIFSLLAVAAILMIDYLGFFEGINNYCYDLSFRLRGSQQHNKEIVLIVVDDESLQKLGRWPIARSWYAEILTKLQAARIVGFDLLFNEPSPDDTLFNQVISAHGKTVLATYITKKHQIARPPFPFPQENLGHVHLDPSVDGVVRDVFNTIWINNTSLPSFASLLYMRSRPQIPSAVSRPEDVPKRGTISTVFQTERMGINFYGNQETFQHIPLADVAYGNRWPESFFENKIVLIGATAVGIVETFNTPFAENGYGNSGVEIQATILNNLLDNSFIKKITISLYYALLLAFTIAIVMILQLVMRGRVALVFIPALILLVLLGYVLFAAFRLWIPPAPFICVCCSVLICAYIYRLEDLAARLKQAGRDWHDSFDSIDDAIVIQNRDGQPVRSNLAADKFKQEIPEDTLKEKTKQLLEGNPQQDVELIVDKNHDTHLEMRSFLRHDIDGHQSGVVHVLRDVTDRIQLEDNQRILQTRLNQSQKMEAIGTLAGGIAHDFNNILSPIIGYTQMVLDSLPEDSEHYAMLSEVKDASLRAKELVRQILSFSRKGDREKKHLYIHPIIREAIKLSRSLLPSSIELKIHLDTTCGTVLCDPSQIHQIIMNLLTNGYQSMTRDGGILEVTLESITLDHKTDRQVGELSAGNYICLSVSDTGHGMDKTTMARIFEPYYTTKGYGEGTGLGLSVVSGIVENHNGHIEAKSEPGVGTTFKVYLPEVTLDGDVTPTEEQTALASGSEHILIIDDEISITKVQARILENLGYQVSSETNPIKALESFRKTPEHYDLVITDQTMPHIRGTDLAIQLTMIRPDIPVLLCTGHSSLITRDKTEEIGIRNLLIKPVEAAELANTVRNTLDGN